MALCFAIYTDIVANAALGGRKCWVQNSIEQARLMLRLITVLVLFGLAAFSNKPLEQRSDNPWEAARSPYQQAVHGALFWGV